MMFSFSIEMSEIYFSQTRDYFREVISTYESNNYRSSVVMLYSVVLCDLLLKLRELSDHYGDKTATAILSEINDKRNDTSNSNRSSWEFDLINQIYKKTSILDDYAYSNLCTLYDYRNFSAHPAMNSEYKLIEPKRETVASCIRNAIDDILTKSPVIANNVIDLLSNDLEARKDFYAGNPDQFETFLITKYFSKMNDTTVILVFKTLWKFVFKLNNEKCSSNRTINRQALKILYKQKHLVIDKYLESCDNLDLEANPDNYEHLVALLAACSPLYKYLQEPQRFELDRYVTQKKELMLLCWYKKKSLKVHIEDLIDLQFDITAREGIYDALVIKCLSDGQIGLLVDFSIDHFGRSKRFFDADHRFDYLIKPVLGHYTKEQARNLIRICSENKYIYKGSKTEEVKEAIIDHFRNLLEDEFPFREYDTFQFDYVTKQDESSEDIVENELPFDL